MKTAETADRKQAERSFWLRLMLDVFLAAVLLAVFYFFLRILPQYLKFEKAQEALNSESSMPTLTEPDTQTANIMFGDPEPESQREPESGAEDGDSFPGTDSPEELRLPFRRTFASFFTEDTALHEDSYTSPDLSVRIREVTDNEHGSVTFRAYIADTTREVRTAHPLYKS